MRKILPIIIAVMVIVVAVPLYYYIQGGGERMERKATITVDGSKRYQRIEGFGGSGAYYEGLLRNLQEPMRAKAADLLFSDLGINIYRLRAWTKIESVNDDDDPNHFNWDAFNFNTDEDQVWNAIEAKKGGVTKFIVSVWSPPAWMKNNSRETEGGYLLPEMYSEFAEWLTAYIIGYKRHHGIDIGWISIQNEPDYVATWETCVYTPEQLRDVIKVVGAKFEAEGIKTKILIPETSGVSNAINYISAIMSDPDAARHVEAFAFHLYDVQFFTPDAGIPGLQSLAKYGTRHNKPLWQTEYSYLDIPEAGTYNEALYTAHHIHNTLTHANASVYLVWELFWYRETGLLSIDKNGASYKVTPKFYTVKQFFNFIRPGYIRIDASANNPNILTSAYIDEENGKITIVVINRAETTFKADFTIKNFSVATLKQYRTTETENCAYVGEETVSNNTFSVNLQPQSVTTFISP